MMMSMLNPNQKQMVNQFQNKSKEEQAAAIADMCNSKGISKEELMKLMNSFKGM